MNLELILLLFWLLILVAAWLWTRPATDERPVVERIALGDRLKWVLFGVRSIEQVTNDDEEQRILREHSGRMRVFALVLLTPLLVYGALLAVSFEDDPEQTVASKVEVDAPIASIPETPDPKVRTYLREPSQPGEPIAEPEEEEPLEEKRTRRRLYATAKVKPLYDNETLLGIQILRVDEGSFWDMIGFKTGDFILEANGELMDTPAASVSFMNAMNTDSELVIRVRGTDEEERVLVFNVSEFE